MAEDAEARLRVRRPVLPQAPDNAARRVPSIPSPVRAAATLHRPAGGPSVWIAGAPGAEVRLGGLAPGRFGRLTPGADMGSAGLWPDGVADCDAAAGPSRSRARAVAPETLAAAAG